MKRGFSDTNFAFVAAPRRRPLSTSIVTIFCILLFIGTIAIVGQWGGLRLAAFLILPAIALLLLVRPVFGLPLIIITALIFPVNIPTGTDVTLNLSALVIPICLAAWIIHMLAQRRISFAPSQANRPLFLFLLSGIFSLAIGNLFWDPAVPKSEHFALVQWAQWAIFSFSAGAFWLGANLIHDEAWLRRITWTFLWVGGGLAILRQLPGVSGLVTPITTIAFVRAPFWVLLASIAGGQILFNHSLSTGRRVYLWLVLLAVFYYAFIAQREAISNWVGVAAVVGILVWLRFPRLRWPAMILLGLLAIIGILFPTVYEFAGGDAEWFASGGSRLALIERVLSVTMRNPFTGLGPASYRPYANVEPLYYRGALWLAPLVNSHNNYVDLFAHTGLLGLGLFLWFALTLALEGWQSFQRSALSPFERGYAAGALAAWVSGLVIMILADWMLPFVYNIGFPGFQASILVWLFAGPSATTPREEILYERSEA